MPIYSKSFATLPDHPLTNRLRAFSVSDIARASGKTDGAITYCQRMGRYSPGMTEALEPAIERLERAAAIRAAAEAQITAVMAGRPE